MGTGFSQTPSQTTQKTTEQDQKTGPALAKSNLDANASLPTPPNGGGLDKLKKDLGTVTGMDGFCSAVGTFLDGLTIGKGTSTKGQLEAKIAIPRKEGFLRDSRRRARRRASRGRCRWATAPRTRSGRGKMGRWAPRTKGASP